MPRREPVAVRTVRNVAQAQRLGLDDQRAEHPAAARAGADGELLVGLEADGQELIECRAVLAQHAQRTITGIDECARLPDQVSEHDRKGELPLDHQHRLHQPPEFDGIVDLIEWWHALRVVVGVDGRKEGPPERRVTTVAPLGVRAVARLLQ